MATRSSARSFEHVVDARTKDQAEPPSPRLGRVRVGLILENGLRRKFKRLTRDSRMTRFCWDGSRKHMD